ncbi:hypothetical protein predicted by Glimmer/Critica [Erwinia amylovora CFBP1430]|uniref:Uncharacterized protein n=1 Tax=Erwinia amylovora (strain CFBP1430) TaxID=665029 RepID=D4I0M8_ERWAC|nr:hypothetical protein predicted by Glimmer/Critica [Erwinia amylovora CFBP1430]
MSMGVDCCLLQQIKINTRKTKSGNILSILL